MKLISKLVLTVITLCVSPIVQSFDYKEAFEEFIDNYKVNYPYQIQDVATVPDDCGPFFVEADPTAEFKGTVVIFHGYTACPQQFYELANILSAQGVNTFVPLLPGQGRGPVPTNWRFNAHQHYSEYLPEHDSWEQYQEFTSDINDMMAQIPGRKMVAGLSVGGALANYAHLEAPGLYDRAITFAPYYGMPGTYLGRNTAADSAQGPAGNLRRLLGDFLYHVQRMLIRNGSLLNDWIADLPITWGPGCYRNSRDTAEAVGRRGICDYRFSNLAAIDQFGDTVIQGNRHIDKELAPQMQYVFVEFDDGADSRLQRLTAADQVAELSDKVDVCFYHGDIPHSFISRNDNPGRDMYWLDSFYSQVVDFLADGQPFQHSDEASEEVLIDPGTGRDTATPFNRCAIF